MLNKVVPGSGCLRWQVGLRSALSAPAGTKGSLHTTTAAPIKEKCLVLGVVESNQLKSQIYFVKKLFKTYIGR